jgi:hypothetical protein
VILLDNLGIMISGAYNKPEIVQSFMWMIMELAEQFNAAVLLAAHPRKVQSGQDPIHVWKNRDDFYEMVMGSSQSINGTGSLWGLERDRENERTCVDLGAERYTGTFSFTWARKTDYDWLQRIDDPMMALDTVVNTSPRQKAWERLLRLKQFTYTEAHNAVRAAGVLKSSKSFTAWWKELLRNKLVVPTAETKDDHYQIAKAFGAAANAQTMSDVLGGQDLDLKDATKKRKAATKAASVN